MLPCGSPVSIPDRRTRLSSKEGTVPVRSQWSKQCGSVLLTLCCWTFYLTLQNSNTRGFTQKQMVSVCTLRHLRRKGLQFVDRVIQREKLEFWQKMFVERKYKWKIKILIPCVLSSRIDYLFRKSSLKVISSLFLSNSIFHIWDLKYWGYCSFLPIYIVSSSD